MKPGEKLKQTGLNKLLGVFGRQNVKIIFITIIFLAISFQLITSNFNIFQKPQDVLSEKGTEKNNNYNEISKYKEITGNIEKGESLYVIFKKYGLSVVELFKLSKASANIYKLSRLRQGHPYKIVVDNNNQINSFSYWINEDVILSLARNESGFYAEKVAVDYEKSIHHIGGVIEDNLILSMKTGKTDREDLMLALQLSDIFAWDIDFTTDMRNGDKFKIVVEGLYLDGEFKKYGNIKAAEFVNRGITHSAYRFEHNDRADYYDNEGKSLKKAFLKAPLSYRHISSGFSKSRFHPVLRIYRPHHGLDYVAPAGTPVSAVGDGVVTFAKYKGQYGNLIIIRHPNGWETYYGHLSRFKKGIRSGVKVEQGQVIGYVGSTGMSTGPHLHYEVRINNRPVNPLTLKMPEGKPVSEELMTDFNRIKNQMDIQLASISMPVLALKNKGTE